MISTCWADDDLAKDLPRIKPLEPAEAIASLRIHPRFRIEPLAVEPLVTDPVSLCFDADGRIYVAEMRGYPFTEGVPSGNVSLLEDTNHDGKVDKSTVFVSGLSWPTGVVPFDGGVFIAVAPDILYAKDTDGDGRADIKKVVFTGFGIQNVQQLLNGLVWGLDGWIYGAAAGNGGEIRNLSHPEHKPVLIRGRDFRFKPDGSAFEAISGGGQFGHSFDDWGRRFVCNNRWHMRQIVLPAHYLERNPALAAPPPIVNIAADGNEAPVFRISPPEPWRVVRSRQYAERSAVDPDFARRLPNAERNASGFFSSATGAMIYRGTAFPPEYRGNAFVADVAGNLVHRKVLTKDGSVFRATRADDGVEFLASTDIWFRPVNFANTPDGTLIVLDMYRETIEHPLSIPDSIKKYLDLTSGKDRGRLYHVVPEGFHRRKGSALSKARTEELVALLADADAWWRETAQRLLVERRDVAAIPHLRTLTKMRPTALARLHALWMLEILGSLRDDDLLTALSDPEPGVRENAIKLAEGHLSQSPPLRDALLALADDPDAMVRFQAAFSLGEIRDARSIVALARIAAHDAGDPWTRVAVLSSISGRTMALVEALAASPGFLDRPEARDWLGDLAALVGAEKKPGEVDAILARFTTSESDPALARALVLGLGRGLQRVRSSLRALLTGPSSDRLEPLFEHSAKLAADESRPADARVEAIRLLGLGPLAASVESLPALLDARQPMAVQLAAIQTLSALDDARVAPALVSHWKALGPSARREAAEALLIRADRAKAFLDAIASHGIESTDLDPARRAQLLAYRQPEVRERAAKLLGTETHPDRSQIISSFRSALSLPGNPDRGRDAFRKVCSSCHRAEGLGPDVGPDLATVVERTPEDLLAQILDPNREVAPTFVNYTVATNDGRILSGLIADESGPNVTLKRAEGLTDTLPRSQIEAMTSTGQSLMPEGLEKDLNPQNMADLIAYIRGIRSKGRPAGGR